MMPVGATLESASVGIRRPYPDWSGTSCPREIAHQIHMESGESGALIQFFAIVSDCHFHCETDGFPTPMAKLAYGLMKRAWEHPENIKPIFTQFAKSRDLNEYLLYMMAQTFIAPCNDHYWRPDQFCSVPKSIKGKEKREGMKRILEAILNFRNEWKASHTAGAPLCAMRIDYSLHGWTITIYNAKEDASESVPSAPVATEAESDGSDDPSV